MLRLHLALIVCVVAFVLLANWQFHRALAGNTLSWAYAVEWPLFTAYAFVLWRRLVLDELGVSTPTQSRHRLLRRRLAARSRNRAHLASSRLVLEDEARERYNEYLASLEQTRPPKVD